MRSSLPWARFPPGVTQAPHGNARTDPLLREHPDVQKTRFTGSTATVKRTMASASRTLKNITLELGGNSVSDGEYAELPVYRVEEEKAVLDPSV